MTLSLYTQMAYLSPSPSKQIPSAAERYYSQPRIGSLSGLAMQSAYQNGVEVRTTVVPRNQESQLLDAGYLNQTTRKGGTMSKRTKTRKRKRSFSISPSRHSPRLMKQKTAALGRMLHERLAGELTFTTGIAGENPRRHTINSLSTSLPALSEDPASYNSDAKDCRFHLPATMEDRLAVRAALTPTLFGLRKKGWDVNDVWNPDASYMEALQKCLQQYYQFEAAKKPDLSPFSLPAVLTLLPWRGKISDFRNSPNWPEGW
jgi:hypothetical protein